MQITKEILVLVASMMFTVIVVVPLCFMLWKRWRVRMMQGDEAFWNVIRAQNALDKNEDSDELFEAFLRSIIKGHISQAKISKMRFYVWGVFSILWAVLASLYAYFTIDYIGATLTFLDSFDPFTLILSMVACLAGCFGALYERNKLRDINILLDSFAEAHGVEGKITIDKLDAIEKLRLSR